MKITYAVYEYIYGSYNGHHGMFDNVQDAISAHKKLEDDLEPSILNIGSKYYSIEVHYKDLNEK